MLTSTLTIAALLVSSVATAPTPLIPDDPQMVSSLESRGMIDETMKIGTTVKDGLKNFKLPTRFKPKDSPVGNTDVVSETRLDQSGLSSTVKKQSVVARLDETKKSLAAKLKNTKDGLTNAPRAIRQRWQRGKDRLSSHFGLYWPGYTFAALIATIPASVGFTCAHYYRMELARVNKQNKKVRNCERQFEVTQNPGLGKREIGSTDEILVSRSPRGRSSSFRPFRGGPKPTPTGNQKKTSSQKKTKDPLRKSCRKSARSKRRPYVSKYPQCNQEL